MRIKGIDTAKRMRCATLDGNRVSIPDWTRTTVDVDDDLHDDLELATRHLNEGDLASAFQRAAECFKRDPESPRAMRLLYALASELGHSDLAICLGKRLVERYPDSEVDSVTLFHCFYRENRVSEAFDEMCRLVALGHSPEYSRLVTNATAEIKDETRRRRFSNEAIHLFRKAKELLDTLSRMSNRRLVSNVIGDSTPQDDQ